MLVTGETTSDGNAGGPSLFPGVAATDSGPNNGNVPIVELAVSNGTASAVWEVVNTNPNTPESFKFAVYVTYTADVTPQLPGAGNRHRPPELRSYGLLRRCRRLQHPPAAFRSGFERRLRVHHSGVRSY